MESSNVAVKDMSVDQIMAELVGAGYIFFEIGEPAELNKSQSSKLGCWRERQFRAKRHQSLTTFLLAAMDERLTLHKLDVNMLRFSALKLACRQIRRKTEAHRSMN